MPRIAIIRGICIIWRKGREMNQPLPDHLNVLFTILYYECHEYGFLSCVKESSSEMICSKLHNSFYLIDLTFIVYL
ncbi:hypothetical protein D3C71_27480 [compost metagenome]